MWRACVGLAALTSGRCLQTKQMKVVAKGWVPGGVGACHKSGLFSVISGAYKLKMMMVVLLLLVDIMKMMLTAHMVRSLMIISSTGSGSHVDHIHVHDSIFTIEAVAVIMTMTVILLDALIAVVTGNVISVTISVAFTILNYVVVVMNTDISGVGPVVVTDDIR